MVAFIEGFHCTAITLMLHTFVVLEAVRPNVRLTPDFEELCPGQDVVLTCSTDSTDSVVMTLYWFHSGYTLAEFSPSDAINTNRDVMIYGYMFSLELTSRMPEFVSTLSFRADAAMNYRDITCRVFASVSGGGRERGETIHGHSILKVSLQVHGYIKEDSHFSYKWAQFFGLVCRDSYLNYWISL